MKKGDMIHPESNDNDVLNDELFTYLEEHVTESPPYIAEHTFISSEGYTDRYREGAHLYNEMFIDMAGVSILFEDSRDGNSRIYEEFHHRYWYVWVIEDVDKFFLWKMSRWD